MNNRRNHTVATDQESKKKNEKKCVGVPNPETQSGAASASPGTQVPKTLAANARSGAGCQDCSTKGVEEEMQGEHEIAVLFEVMCDEAITEEVVRKWNDNGMSKLNELGTFVKIREEEAAGYTKIKTRYIYVACMMQ
eukprot:4302884-Amphidinium_carterae.2